MPLLALAKVRFAVSEFSLVNHTSWDKHVIAEPGLFTLQLLAVHKLLTQNGCLDRIQQVSGSLLKDTALHSHSQCTGIPAVLFNMQPSHLDCGLRQLHTHARACSHRPRSREIRVNRMPLPQNGKLVQNFCMDRCTSWPQAGINSLCHIQRLYLLAQLKKHAPCS